MCSLVDLSFGPELYEYFVNCMLHFWDAGQGQDPEIMLTVPDSPEIPDLDHHHP